MHKQVIFAAAPILVQDPALGDIAPTQLNLPAPLIVPLVTAPHLHRQLNRRLAMKGRDTASELEQTLTLRLKTHLEDGLIRTSRLSLTLIPRCSS